MLRDSGSFRKRLACKENFLAIRLTCYNFIAIQVGNIDWSDKNVDNMRVRQKIGLATYLNGLIYLVCHPDFHNWGEKQTCTIDVVPYGGLKSVVAWRNASL